MKNIFCYIVILLFLFKSNICPAAVRLESPACIPQLRVKNPAIDKLLNLLKEKKYKSYYKELCEFGTKNNRKIADDRDIDEEFRNFVWYYYLLANLPVFNSKLYMETESETYDYRDFKEVFDLWLKLQKSSSLAGGITTLHDSNKIRESLKKQILTRTILSYYVCIISQFKNAYETNPWGERPSEDRLRLGIDVIFRQMPGKMYTSVSIYCFSMDGTTNSTKLFLRLINEFAKYVLCISSGICRNMTSIPRRSRSSLGLSPQGFVSYAFLN